MSDLQDIFESVCDYAAGCAIAVGWWLAFWLMAMVRP